MVDRILEILKRKNLTPSQFADEVGVQRSAMSHLLSGRNKPSLDFVLKILKRYPDITSDWMLHGQNPVAGINPVAENDNLVPEIPLDWGVTDKVEPEEGKKVSRVATVSGQVKKIERIVVFYRDRTFKEYLPESGL